MEEINIFDKYSRGIIRNLENKVFLDSFLDIYDAHFGSKQREKQMEGLRKLGISEAEMEVHACIIYNNRNFYYSIFNRYHLNNLEYFIDKKKLKSADLTDKALIIMFNEAKRRGLSTEAKLDGELLQSENFKSFSRAMTSEKASECVK